MTGSKMNQTMGRRSALGGLTAISVVGFDPHGCHWIPEGDPMDEDCVALDDLDGELVFDAESLNEAADDFGHIIHRPAFAVLRPGSVDDIVNTVEFARCHGLRVAMRGQGHARFGQAQTNGGIVIDSRSLATIHEIAPGLAIVDAGVTWRELVAAALATGQTVPVLNDFMGLSVGGTLSVGGFGGATHRHGLQIDNILELEVVTGTGDYIQCSSERDPTLFESVLGGMGQFAIIVRATVRLVPAHTTVRSFQLSYSDLATFMADQRRLVGEERFDHVTGQARLTATGPAFTLEAVVFYSEPDAPDDASLLEGSTPLTITATDIAYSTWIVRLDPIVQAQINAGVWQRPHPWFDVFLSDDTAESYISSVLSTLTTADTGNGPIIIFPFNSRYLTRPFAMMPDADLIFVFGIFRLAVDEANAAPMVEANRVLFEDARDVGAKQYPIDAIPMDPEDWTEHFGENWNSFCARKGTYDPDHVLTPGPGFFVADE